MPVCRLSLLVFVVAVGCTRPYKRSQTPLPTTPPEPVAQVPVPTPPSPPPLVEPPPPLAAVADTPGLPDPAGVIPAAHEDELDDTRRQERQKKRQERREDRREGPKPAEPKPPEPAPAPPPATVAPPVSQAPPSDREAIAKLVEAAAARWATVPDFEARLVKREVAHGKPQPQCEMLYRFRQSPHSVYMKIVAGAGEGREVLYVQGKFADKMHILTGKGDNMLVGVGFKTEMDPHDKQATAKSRLKITDAGFGRVIKGLQKQLATPTPGVTLKSLGQVQRPEYPYPLDGVEAVCTPGADPLLPKGGTRHLLFDPKADSAGYRLPVLVVCHEPDGREVEYYSFDRVKVPSGWQDGDWHPGRLKK